MTLGGNESQLLNITSNATLSTCHSDESGHFTTLHFDTTTAIVGCIDLVVALITVLGNSLAILAVFRFRRLRTMTNTFVVSLAAADFLVGLTVPFYVSFYFISWSCDRYACLMRYWFTILATGCSMLCLVGVAIDRYLAVLHCMSYHRLMRTQYATYYVVAVWTYMAVISSLPLFGVGATEDFDRTKVECDLYYIHTHLYALLAVAAHVILSLTIIVVLYVPIFRAALRQNRALYGVVVILQEVKARQEARTARTMALVMGVCLIGFLPYLVIITCRYFRGVSQQQVDFVKRLLVSLYFGKSAANPLVYAWMNKDFRDAFRKLMSLKRKPSLNN